MSAHAAAPCHVHRRDRHFKITGAIHYKGGIRVSMLCGMDALKDYRKKQKTVTELSVMLSAKPESRGDCGKAERTKTE